jgi:hypothetical protein
MQRAACLRIENSFSTPLTSIKKIKIENNNKKLGKYKQEKRKAKGKVCKKSLGFDLTSLIFSRVF